MEGWLTKFTDWLKRQLVEFFNALIALIDDVMMLWIETSINNIAWVLDHIPPPQFMTEYSVSGLLGQAGPTVGWLVETMQIGPAMGVMGSAISFYIVRRFLTLGIW